MQFKAHHATAFLLIVFANISFSAPPDVIDLAESSFQQKSYVSYLTASNLTNSPKWNAEKDLPPLSPARAALFAISNVHAQLGNHPNWPKNQIGWMVDQTTLVLFGQQFWNREMMRPEDSERWYYRMKLVPRAAGSNSFKPVTVFVTFDGTVTSLIPSGGNGE